MLFGQVSPGSQPVSRLVFFWGVLGATTSLQQAPVQRRPTHKVPLILARVPSDLRSRDPLAAKSSVRGPQLDLPGPREGSSILNVDLSIVFNSCKVFEV